MRAFLFCHPERSGERKREPRSRTGLARKRTCYKFFCRVRNCSLFLARSLRLVAFTGLPKSIEELFGKRSGRRSGQGGKRSEPSAMAPWRDEVGMTKRSKASFHPSKIYHSTFYIYHFEAARPALSLTVYRKRAQEAIHFSKFSPGGAKFCPINTY